jgi:hypothetical protein
MAGNPVIVGQSGLPREVAGERHAGISSHRENNRKYRFWIHAHATIFIFRPIHIHFAGINSGELPDIESRIHPDYSICFAVHIYHTNIHDTSNPRIPG